MHDTPDLVAALALAYRVTLRDAPLRIVPCEACGAVDRWYVSEFEPDGETPRWYTCACEGRNIRAERIQSLAPGGPDETADLLEDAWTATQTALASTIERLVRCGCFRCRAEARALSSWLHQGPHS